MKTYESGLYRVIDANFNRAREGIRVLEEVARFVLEDIGLAGRCRSLRHRLRVLQQVVPGAPRRLLEARDAAADVGLNLSAVQEYHRMGYVDLATANFKRVQEALRVLEEYTKFFRADQEFKEIRFEIYELEKKMMMQPGLKDFSGQERQLDYSLYVIVGQKFTLGRPLEEVVEAAIAGGATVIQLREKDCPARRLIEAGMILRRLTREKEVPLIVNDRVDVALAVGADGVHLGQDDLPLAVAREILGPGKVIGISTHSVEEALLAQQQGADYIGVGPIYETKTKDAADNPVGLELLSQMAGKITIPRVAIGGITAENAYEVVLAGADGVAVITAVASAADVEGAASMLGAAVRRAKLARQTGF